MLPASPIPGCSTWGACPIWARWAPRATPRAADVGAAIAGYLADIGFNVDFAPVADVLTNPNNPVIGPRSFGSDPQLVGDMVAAQVKAMLEAGVLPCAKHFPGHGDTSEDSHTGAAVTQRTAQELATCEYVPFKKAIAAGCPMVMVGHIQTPQVNGDDLPASLSSQMIDGVLRGELGFEGVVVADSFEMGAVIQAFDAGEAAVRFIQAGGDLILLPLDLELAYQGVLSAVREGGYFTRAPGPERAAHLAGEGARRPAWALGLYQ